MATSPIEHTALWLDLGTVAYAEALDLQRRLAALRACGAVPDLLLLCQHPPVFTIGRGGGRHHLREEAGARGVPIHEVERGGNVTYHGPGQLLAYPILALEGARRDLHWLLRSLEEVALRALESCGLPGQRLPGLTGVWLGKNKVCAIGVAVRRWVTLHGLALNVSTDLQPFEWIVPCGLHGYGVTSMERVLGVGVPLGRVTAEVVRQFGAVFSRVLRPAHLSDLPPAAHARPAPSPAP